MSMDIFLSVPNGADVVVGQGIILDVKISSKTKLPSNFSIKLESLNGLMVDPDYPGSPTLNSNGDFFTQSFFLRVSNSISSVGSVSYVLSPSVGIPVKITYYANEFDINSGGFLTLDKKIIETPIENNNPTDNGNTYLTYFVNLKNKTGEPLKRTPAMFYIFYKNKMEDFVYTNDPDHDGLPLKIIDIRPHGDHSVIIINSDDLGYISFRAYPKKDKVLSAACFLLLDMAYMGDRAYIILPYSKGFGDFLPKPIIPELINGKLYKGAGEQFEVDVPSYTGVQLIDRIVFFSELQDDMPVSDSILYEYVMESSQGHNFRFFIPYDKLPAGKEITLYYFIVTSDGNRVMYSNFLNFEYIIK
ncbi:hypothetical protein [Xenorhabdus sp. PB30.3]|uniref:hypothetical protein n=1 Tax=Xenorhabdus sp. PB30.3 TaxID=2788941 RepID=UPI001E31775D|nr:hypothetical protein [Xenorhabdus sp. PB30.3]MCC8380680.1 hypothetical protein [Xenorhabdus sp. PB30.3]